MVPREVGAQVVDPAAPLIEGTPPVAPPVVQAASSHLDQPLVEATVRTVTVRNPGLFPGLVRLPIAALIEQLDPSFQRHRMTSLPLRSGTPVDALRQGPLGLHRPNGRAGLGAGKEALGERSRPPRQAVLEPSGCRTLPKDWSERLWANRRLRSIPVTFRSSPTTVSYREASSVVAWWHRGGGVPTRLASWGARRCVTPTSMPPA